MTKVYARTCIYNLKGKKSKFFSFSWPILDNINLRRQSRQISLSSTTPTRAAPISGHTLSSIHSLQTIEYWRWTSEQSNFLNRIFIVYRCTVVCFSTQFLWIMTRLHLWTLEMHDKTITRRRTSPRGGFKPFRTSYFHRKSKHITRTQSKTRC